MPSLMLYVPCNFNYDFQQIDSFVNLRWNDVKNSNLKIYISDEY